MEHEEPIQRKPYCYLHYIPKISNTLLAICHNVLKQEPQIAPDEQLAPCMAASAISV